MPAYRATFSQVLDRLFLDYVGMETYLIFNRGVDLPGFATFPLLESDDGRNMLMGYCREQIELAREYGLGVILESPTWMANADRAAPLGFGAEDLRRLNRAAISLVAEARDRFGDAPTVLSANIGPRQDAYAPASQMTVGDARDYHLPQMQSLAGTEVDVASGFTIAYAAEAAGISLAARDVGLPCVISFTVETDGRLPTGQPLAAAIAEVDAASDGYPAYYMINCAHPDHFGAVLGQDEELSRLKGLVANASRCSHAELDEAKTLDDGNPHELGQLLGRIKRDHPGITVLGGCCGTDLRHMTEIAAAVSG
ncbi:homocysteine S-methyltransferase family protein [Shimia biformata]|uniref:homocysteine S-methyltransferase family protein n=1 Tax=Shimia biformata TaxID=1294299 RepID=UPI00194DBCBC|nr:homocysteine S-methyltransferase family protein [Shimia biformata]